MSRHQEDNSWITSAGVVLGAVTSAVINELHAGWPWWIAAVVLIGATAWLARRQPSTSGAHRSATNSGPGGKPGRWWGPATAVAATVGSAAIVWWPLRWRPEWLGFMPERLLQFLLWVLLVVGLCTLALRKLRAAGAALLVVFLAGLAVAPPAAAVADRQCGTAMIVTQPSLMAAVDAALDAMRKDAAVECAEALWPVRADTDVQAQLRNSAAVVGGLITSDPGLIGKLRSWSAEFRVVAEPVESWTGIGNDVASVFLPSGRGTRSDNSVPFKRSVPLRALPGLAFPAATPTDPVAMRTAAALGQGRQLRSTTGFGAEEGTCPTGVVIAGSWVDPPCDHAGLVRATVLGDTGGAIGVPVLGVPLRPSGLYGPGEQAKKAVTALFRRLSLDPGKAHLADPPGDIDAAVERNKDLKPVVMPKPVHLIAVVDSSLSTGRNADSRDRGGRSPLDAALNGLVIANQAIARPGGTSLLFAQDARRAAVEWPAGDRPAVPGVTAKGTSKLPTYLAEARARQDDAGRRGERPVVVLLTDGVNVFSEYPLPAALPPDVAVIVIGNRRDCAAVPARLRTHCLPARGAADDVAQKLARVLTGT